MTLKALRHVLLFGGSNRLFNIADTPLLLEDILVRPPIRSRLKKLIDGSRKSSCSSLAVPMTVHRMCCITRRSRTKRQSFAISFPISSRRPLQHSSNTTRIPRSTRQCCTLVSGLWLCWLIATRVPLGILLTSDCWNSNNSHSNNKQRSNSSNKVNGANE